ncbi:MAG: sugar phosphate isomerase/epimerase [Kiritimatiellia bacterium]|nr:sugar phosphate isomerase/epimerase [Kiritimatiellia bacterium]
MSKPVIGAQLYTLRDFCKTADDLARTLVKVRKIGYTAAQVSGIGPIDPAEVAKAAKNAGVAICATHMGWNRFLHDLDRVIDEHRMWGCKHAAIGGLPPAEYLHAAGVARFLDELAPIAAKLSDAGMDFSYHNHSNELALFEGRTWLGRLYETAKPEMLKAEIDTYWIQAGGGDPADWVRKCAGREPLLHLKDMCVLPDRTQRYAPIGAGNLNWSAIFREAEAGGVEFALVEQDQCYEANPFEALTASYLNLRAFGYE